MMNVLKTFLLASVPLMFLGCGPDTTGGSSGNNGSSNGGNTDGPAKIHATALPGVMGDFYYRFLNPHREEDPQEVCSAVNECDAEAPRAGTWEVTFQCPLHLFLPKQVEVGETGVVEAPPWNEDGSDWCMNATGRYQGSDDREYNLTTRYDQNGTCRITGLPIGGDVTGGDFTGRVANTPQGIRGTISADAQTVQFAITYDGSPDDPTVTLNKIPE